MIRIQVQTRGCRRPIGLKIFDKVLIDKVKNYYFKLKTSLESSAKDYLSAPLGDILVRLLSLSSQICNKIIIKSRSITDIPNSLIHFVTFYILNRFIAFTTLYCSLPLPTLVIKHSQTRNRKV